MYHFLLVLGGCINLLIEMKALTEGLAALSRITKGNEFLLLTLVFIIISIGGSTFGMCEETFAFFPILMPIFLKSGINGMLGMASIYLGSMIGIMFSTLNAFSVVLGCDSAGIDFMNGIIFRIISYVLGNKKEIIKRNFLAGIFRGVGIGIGITIVTTLIVYIFRILFMGRSIF